MNPTKQILHLLQYQFKLESKSPHVLAANVLYVVTIIFIIYRIFNQISPPAWVAVFWIVFMFTTINVTIHSYSKEQGKSVLFFYSIMHPMSLYVSRTLFNFLVICMSSFVVYLFMTLFLENPVIEQVMFLKTVLLSSLAVSIIFSFTSAIAVHTHMKHTMMTLLSLPLIIPVILVAVKLSLVAVGTIIDDGSTTDFNILIGINLIMLGIGSFLFPYLWRS